MSVHYIPSYSWRRLTQEATLEILEVELETGTHHKMGLITISKIATQMAVGKTHRSVKKQLGLREEVC